MRGRQSKKWGDGGCSGLRTRRGGQQSFSCYLYNFDLNFPQEMIGGGYIIIALIFIG